MINLGTGYNALQIQTTAKKENKLHLQKKITIIKWNSRLPHERSRVSQLTSFTRLSTPPAGDSPTSSQ